MLTAFAGTHVAYTCDVDVIVRPGVILGQCGSEAEPLDLFVELPTAKLHVGQRLRVLGIMDRPASWADISGHTVYYAFVKAPSSSTRDALTASEGGGGHAQGFRQDARRTRRERERLPRVRALIQTRGRRDVAGLATTRPTRPRRGGDTVTRADRTDDVLARSCSPSGSCERAKSSDASHELRLA